MHNVTTESTNPDRFLVQPGTHVDLRDLPTVDHDISLDKATAKAQLKSEVAKISRLQERLFAEASQSLLLILQGMDAAGKDSTIRRVTKGVNPMGLEIHSFRAPTDEDYAQSYLQRHWASLPSRGSIGIHNRSHYEEVLVTRVHPSLLHLRQIRPEDVDDDFWEERFADIRALERHAARQNRTTIVKVFLHISQATQRKRLLKRINNPDKQWKFDIDDLRERQYWSDYQYAYSEAISATSTTDAPWYVIPTDVRHVARLAIGEILAEKLAQMNPQFPQVPADLHKMKHEL